MKCCLKGYANKPSSIQHKIVLGVYHQGPFIRGGDNAFIRGFYLSKRTKHHLILKLLAAIIPNFKIKCRTMGLNKLIVLDLTPPPQNLFRWREKPQIMSKVLKIIDYRNNVCQTKAV